jgi:ornithine carbamoyltransferase
MKTTNKNLKHLLTGEELSSHEAQALLEHGLHLKKIRHMGKTNELSNCHLAMLFDKQSLRTRFSFAVGMNELGGDAYESISCTRKAELPEDQARVLSGYCQAIMIRTHLDSTLERMSQASSVPIINGLSNLHHPCQILADLMTLLEVFGDLKGLTLTYIGDGNNILHSLLLLSPQLGVNIHYCCPETREPDADILAKSLEKLGPNTGTIKSFKTPAEAVKNANAIYTDVWTSMGFEAQSAEHLFQGFQVNETLMQQAAPNAVFMHCLPMERGKEVSETLPDQPCSVIFTQSENRLHIQKAVLLHLIKENNHV